MKNRVAWCLAVLLAVVLTGSLGLVAALDRRQSEENRWVLLLPTAEWGFGSDQNTFPRIAMKRLRYLIRYPGSSVILSVHRRYRVGFLSLRVN
jgi:hypothetical protein